MRLYIALSTLLAIAAADQNTLSFHPNFDAGFMRTVCNASVTTPPVVSVYDTGNYFSTNNGQTLIQSKVCPAFTKAPIQIAERTVTNVACSTSGNTVSLNITSNDVGGLASTVAYCKFSVNVSTSCAATHHKHGNDKKSELQSNLTAPTAPCYTQTTFGTCMPGCSQPPQGADTLSQCPCIWNPPGSVVVNGVVNQTATCPPGAVCCWDQPCIAWSTASDCSRGGGGNGLLGSPSNCAFSNNLCSCAVGNATIFENSTILAGSPNNNPVGITLLNTGTRISAPFDCSCGDSAVAESGVCIGVGGITTGGGGITPPPSPPPASSQTDFLFGIALAREIQLLAVLIYTKSCHPCVISFSDNGNGNGNGNHGDHKRDGNQNAASACLQMRDSNNGLPIWFDWNNNEAGCTFTVSADSCSQAYAAAQHIVQGNNAVAVSYIESASTVTSAAVSSNALAVFSVVVALLATLLL